MKLGYIHSKFRKMFTNQSKLKKKKKKRVLLNLAYYKICLNAKTLSEWASLLSTCWDFKRAWLTHSLATKDACMAFFLGKMYTHIIVLNIKYRVSCIETEV